MTQFEDTREAVTAIGQKAGPEATGLLVALMEQDRRHIDWVDEQIRGGLEAERDRWKARALDAERHLAVIEARIMGLLSEPDFDPYDGGM